MELAKVENQIDKFNGIKDAVKQFISKTDIIVNQETLPDAISLAKNGKKMSSLIDEKRKTVTRPILEQKKEIDGFVKELSNEIDESVSNLRRRIFAFKKSVGDDKGIMKTVSFEIENESEIPREFLKVDEKAIKDAFKDNSDIVIPGVKKVNKETLYLR